jgi:hypothetical protein
MSAAVRIPTRSKYGNRKTRVDGITFDSKAEARRFGELKLLQKAGEIKHLKVHSRYSLSLHLVKLGFYEDDFSYYDMRQKRMVYEDVKGYRKGCAYDLFRLKKKLMFALLGITIREVTT